MWCLRRQRFGVRRGGWLCVFRPGSYVQSVDPGRIVTVYYSLNDTEAYVDEHSQVLLSTLLGAVVGAVVGGLYLTERGRRVRDQIEPTLDNFVSEIERVRGTVDKAREAAQEGRQAFEDAMRVATPNESVEEAESNDATWATSSVREASS